VGEKIKSILSINAGSSSIKLDLFLVKAASQNSERVLEASITGIGQAKTVLSVRQLAGEKQRRELTIADHAGAIKFFIHWLDETISTQTITAIGHRVVHGGPEHNQAELITDDLERELKSFISFDPEHAPAALQLIRAMRQEFPDIPQVACFDTAFAHGMPRIAQLLPLPRKLEAQGLRRYGFHGLSYTYLMSAFRRLAGDDAANGRIILAHLGSGASLTAMTGGQPFDTTMSFTPTSGILMSSRSGDLDPGILSYLHRRTGMTIAEYTHMVNFESGLLGVSELSADMYTLLQHEATNRQAAEAIDLFVYQIKKSIGALTATLGGLDSLVFTGGIGERSALIRARVCDNLGYLGIELDAARNERQVDLISAHHSRVGVHVIPTDEAQVITKQVLETLDINNSGGEAHHGNN